MYNNAPTDSVSPWLNVCTDLLLLKRSLLSLAVGRYCVSVFLLYLVSSPVSCQQLRNRAPSTGQVSPGPTWLATGKCFRADRPAVGEPHRTRDAQSQCHCTRIPSYMLARSSSGRTPLTGPGQWLVFCDHFSAGFLCARVRLVHHHQHPLLHPQMGRMYLDSGWTYDKQNLHGEEK